MALAFLPLATLSCSPSGADANGTTLPAENGTALDSSPAKPAVKRSGQAKLAFEQTTLDFGDVWDVGDLEGKFPFTNTGGRTLVIGEIKPSCGCTTTKLDRQRFEPGESSSIDVHWKPKGFGSQAKTINVMSNGEGPGIEVLMIRANIKPFAQFSENPMRLGILAEGEELRRTVNLSCADPNFEVLELLTGNRYLTTNNLGKQADGTYKIELVFGSDTPWGQQTCSVQAKVRGRVDGEGEVIEHTALLSISAWVFGELRVEPTLFAVGYVPLKGNFERVVSLKHISHLPFEVTRAEVIDSQPPGMTVVIEPYDKGIDKGVVLRVKGEAGDYQGLIRGSVVFETNIPGEQARTVPIMGIVRK